MSAPLVEMAEGDCLEVLKALDDNFVDAIVTDPPYGLSEHRPADVAECLAAWLLGEPYRHKKKGMMSKAWDGWPPGPEVWRECLRVLKPGGHLVAFGGTRSYDLLVLAIRLAGFEIRDSLHWFFGSGWSKSPDVSKLIDKAAGAERQVTGPKADPRWQAGGSATPLAPKHGWNNHPMTVGSASPAAWITAPATPEAREWSGYGLALSPAHEPIVLARKPLDGTVVENILRHGAGALHIDACRTGTSKRAPSSPDRETGTVLDGSVDGSLRQRTGAEPSFNPNLGRWPKNVLFCHDPDCRPVETRLVQGDPREGRTGRRPGGFGDVGANRGTGGAERPCLR